jgi:hypothetical protein
MLFEHFPVSLTLNVVALVLALALSLIHPLTAHCRLSRNDVNIYLNSLFRYRILSL